MLTEEDFKTRIYPELIDAISREDDEVLHAAMAAAEGEAMGYLSHYDINALLGAQDDDRDAVLLMKLKDIAAWHFIALANADIQLELTKTRYDEAIKWLERIQMGKIVYNNWPLPSLTEDEEDNSGSWLVSSEPKRNTHY